MSFLLAKTLLVSMFFVTCISVFGDEIDALPGSFPPTNYHHGQHHGPVASPTHAPTHAPTHHHKSQPPSHAAHPPTAQPPSHHHHKGHAPVQPPSAQPPTHKHHHPKSPAAAPSHPPAVSPSHPPAKPPSRPIPERKLVAVQGVVYCKACKYRGVDTLLGASPLVGAVVRLQCNNSRYAPLIQDGKTDARGYFFIQAKKLVTTYGAHKCKVSLVSSPLKSCNKATDLHAGAKGAILMKPVLGAPGKPPLPYAVFTVGPFAFEASKQAKCPR